MKQLGELFQTADWKAEKHVPVIEMPAEAKKGENIKMSVTVGKQIAHPNTTEHHIAWVEVLFSPDGEKFPYHLGRFEFLAHGASTQGPNTSTVYTHPEITATFKTEKSGTVYAYSYCNIHGLWTSSMVLKVE
jgi:superoxide reductase